jgi:hypothetical protein
MLQWLSRAVAAMSAGDRLSYALIGHIIDRIRVVNQRFRRLVARLAAGTFRPRRRCHRRKSIDPKPRRKNPLPHKFGWLLPLVPEAVQYRGQLEYLFHDPAMIALLEAAPAPMARILRPLCWALHLPLPPILSRTRSAAAPPPAQAATAPQAPPPPPPPRLQRRSPAPARTVPSRACGPPHRA